MLTRLRCVCLAAIVLLCAAGCITVPASGAVSSGFSVDLSYSSLDAHGAWLVSADYGRVWQPREYTGGWNPYADGHWVYTDLGWTWVSDYDWGSIPYHYGTWTLDADLGWVWVPGTVWAPAWVVFRTGPDYIGWAPVSPTFTLGASLSFEEPRADAFVFVSAGDFLSPRIGTSFIRDTRRGAIINNTRIVNNITIENNVVVNRGPDVVSVERASGRQVRPVRIEEVARVAPGRNVDREQLRVDSRGERDLRATRPIPKDQEPSIGATAPEAGRQRPDTAESRQDRRRDMRPRPPEGSPGEPGVPPPPRDDPSRGPDPGRPNPRETGNGWSLRPHESGPEHTPNVDSSQNKQNDDKAAKPQDKKPPRKKPAKPRKEKPSQGNGNDEGQKPPGL